MKKLQGFLLKRIINDDLLDVLVERLVEIYPLGSSGCEDICDFYDPNLVMLSLDFLRVKPVFEELCWPFFRPFFENYRGALYDNGVRIVKAYMDAVGYKG